MRLEVGSVKSMALYRMEDGQHVGWDPWPPHLNHCPACRVLIPPALTFGGKKAQTVERVQDPLGSRGLGCLGSSWKAECPIWRPEWLGVVVVVVVVVVVDSLDREGGLGSSMGGGLKNPLGATMGVPVNGGAVEDAGAAAADVAPGWPMPLRAK